MLQQLPGIPSLKKKKKSIISLFSFLSISLFPILFGHKVTYSVKDESDFYLLFDVTFALDWA